MAVESIDRDIPHICASCSLQFRTCCRCDPDEFIIPTFVSIPEIERIESVMGRDIRENEMIHTDNTPEFIREMLSLFPDNTNSVIKRFPTGGKHYALSMKKNGGCVFLSDTGCRLDNRCRPLFCQLFPVWFRGEKIIRFIKDDCLAIIGNYDNDQLLALFGLSRDSAFGLYQKIRDDWEIRISG
jgi:Fe-S-cluster containining protein